jgi:hypothetical protein
VEPSTAFRAEPAMEQGRLPSSRGITPLRLACVTGVWSVIGFVSAHGAPLPAVWAATMLASVLGLAIALMDTEEPSWTGVLAAAVLLGTSPFLQKYWLMPREEPAWDALSFLKSVLVVGGLLLLARLEAGTTEAGEGTAHP